MTDADADPTDLAAAEHAEAAAALGAGELVRAAALAATARDRFAAACGDDHPDVANTDILRSRIAREASDYPAALAHVDRAVASLDAARREYPDEPVVVEIAVEAAAQRS